MNIAQTIAALADYVAKQEAAEKAAGSNIDQDWEAETTTYTFEDGSRLVDCNGAMQVQRGRP